MGLGIGLPQIVNIIGRHQGNLHLAGEFHQQRVHSLLRGNTVIHEFKIEVLRAHDLPILACQFAGGFFLFLEQ